ncbi:MAG TPA: MgtC/SapB family protein [Thermoanaerobaculia bacterium]|nr:MgtC/SapB family protein [Thermoanaerobaculia bacterium]
MGNPADLPDFFVRLGIALGLGLFVGLQRERGRSLLAGVRTFALATAFGTVAGWLARIHGGWVVAAGLLALAAFGVVGNVLKLRTEPADPGLTTEVALLLMYGLGAFLVDGPKEVAIVLGGAVALLLHLKPQLQRLSTSIGDEDFAAIMRFAVLSMVVLPVLPDQSFGPHDVLSLRSIWLMVVLIVGLDLAGYLGFKLLGQRGGAVLAGLLGGLISSTATTVTYSRRVKDEAALARLGSFVILLASGVVFARLIVEITAVAPGFLAQAGPPLAVLLVVCVGLAFLTFQRADRAEPTVLPEPKNPSQLKPALYFALIYAVVLVAVAVAREQFGSAGLYSVAVLSGLTDMDAITLSTSQLVSAGTLDPATGWRAIVLAGLSNLAFKTGVVAFLGPRALLRRILLGFGGVVVAGVLLLLFGG